MLRGVEACYRQEHAVAPVLLQDESDVDDFIDSLSRGQSRENLAQLHSLDRNPLPSGYPDHELLVGVDGIRGVGVLSFMDSENYVSRGSEGKASRYYLSGCLQEFPAGAEISIDSVRRAVREFLLAGGCRPKCIDWDVPEIWPYSSELTEEEARWVGEANSGWGGYSG